MTIIDIVSKAYSNNRTILRALENIRDNYTILVNDNYELVIDSKYELKVKIPSLTKRDEFEYKDIGDYDYPLVMCMRISESVGDKRCGEILNKFMVLYKSKLEIYFKDFGVIDRLLGKVKKLKYHMEYITYMCIALGVFGGGALCIFPSFETITKRILTVAIIICFGIAIIEQFTKENRVKKMVDAHISVIKTDWYQRQLQKEHSYICNYVGKIRD
ncbi:hypothetical protein [Clostridium ihumii]|uniref:hypothetical protein n=1 Tax=Clostridium ihumii TaxID=1470356 RepID=UPI0005904BE0|nr:hypothetical protein [Clostridium ihumii]